MDYAVCSYRIKKVWGLEEGYKMVADAGFTGIDFSFFDQPLPASGKPTVYEKGLDEMEKHYAPEI